MELKQVIICNNCLSTHPDNDETIIGDTCENCEDGTMQNGTLFLAGTEPQAEHINEMVTSKLRSIVANAEANELGLDDSDLCPKCGGHIEVTGIGNSENDAVTFRCTVCPWEMTI